ncbi:MAG: flagellin, partial [Comamonas sp.]
TISIQGATHPPAIKEEITRDANVTDEEALGKVVAAINSKTADTGVTAYHETDDAGAKSIQFRATAKADGTTGTVTVSGAGLPSTTLTAQTDAKLKGIDDLDISTQAGSWEALQSIDSAIDKVSTARGELGAVQTRFEKAVENIDIQNENLSAARGRITDADFAKETANLSRTQILQQAGTAMVAQANQLPQQVLSLLR